MKKRQNSENKLVFYRNKNKNVFKRNLWVLEIIKIVENYLVFTLKSNIGSFLMKIAKNLFVQAAYITVNDN